MKINSVKISRMHNDEHFQFIAELIALIERLGADALRIVRHFTLLTAVHEREDAALKKIPASIYTQKLKDADNARDNVITGLFEANKALKHHFTPAVREAGARIQLVLNAYKDLERKSYNEETSAIYNLVQELKTAKYLTDVQTAGLSAWVTEAERLNNVFDSLMKASFDEKSQQCDEDMKAVRKEEDAVYHDICEIINARVKDEGPEDYEEFIKALNAVVARYKATLNRRLGHSHHSHTSNPPDDTSTSLSDQGTTPPDDGGTGSDGEGGRMAE